MTERAAEMSRAAVTGLLPHRRASAPALAAAGLVAATALTGCGAPPERSAVVGAATGFVTAVTGRDGHRACALLTSNAADAASGATKVPCASAVLNLPERGSGVRGVQVWGDAAQVRVGSDVLFLRRLASGWRVVAAGCKPQPGTAYSFELEG